MDMQVKTMLPARPWELAALAQARRNALALVERSMRAAEGDLDAARFAVAPAFLRAVVALTSRADAVPCMECSGGGFRQDPEAGPYTCEHCDGMGVHEPKAPDSPAIEKTGNGRQTSLTLAYDRKPA